MSDLLDVYRALENRPVRLGGVTVPCYGLSGLKNTLDSNKTPYRMLLPMGTATEGQSFGFVALGRTYEITWQIADVFIYKAITQGLGIQENAPALMEYCGAYADMLQGFRAPTPQTYIENVSITPAMFEWPAESGFSYAAVIATLQVIEVKGG